MREQPKEAYKWKYLHLFYVFSPTRWYRQKKGNMSQPHKIDGVICFFNETKVFN